MNFTYFTLSRLFEIRFVQRDQTLWCAGRNFGILVVKNYTFRNYIPGVQKKNNIIIIINLISALDGSDEEPARPEQFTTSLVQKGREFVGVQTPQSCNYGLWCGCYAVAINQVSLLSCLARVDYLRFVIESSRCRVVSGV